MDEDTQATPAMPPNDEVAENSEELKEESPAEDSGGCRNAC